MTPVDRMRELAAPLLADAGLELWDVEVARGVVRVLVERAGGVDLDALSAASRVLSPLLDEHPELVPAGPYQLEVSSPGVERPLRSAEHFRRHVGAEISVRTTVPVEGARRVRGVLADAGEESFTVVGDGDGDGAGPGPTVTVRYDQVDRARTVMAWGPSSSPDQRRRSGAGGADRRRAPGALNRRDT